MTAAAMLPSGGATTETVVVTKTLELSALVARMVTVWVVPGAVQTPVAALMVPAVAVQVRPLVAPPLAEALKGVLVP